MKTISVRELDDGRVHYRITEAALPTLRVVPNPRVGAYGRRRVARLGAADRRHPLPHLRGRPGQGQGRARREALAHERQAVGGAHRGRAPAISRRLRGAGRARGRSRLHSDEHLATSDQGVVMLRRLLQRQLDAVAAGGDPAGVSFDPAAPPVSVRGRQLHHGPERRQGRRAAECVTGDDERSPRAIEHGEERPWRRVVAAL